MAAHPENNRESPSEFEIGAAAAAYNALADAPDDSVRARLAAWLAGAPPVFVHDDGRYVANKSMVEAYALLELCRAGTAVRADAPALCRRGRRLITHGLAVAAAGATTPDHRGRPAVVVSDPPANPIAYHQPVMGYLARSLTIMPPDRATRGLLVRMARGLNAYAAPDGDVSYWGRSQDQGWSLPLGAYGLRAAAGLTAGDEAREFRATADRLLSRFQARHAGGPYGTFITPSFGADPLVRPQGIDPYANAATYAGLTAFVLSWLADQGAPSGDARPVLADRRSFIAGTGMGRFATVRRGPVWFAVRQRSDGSGDLRYDVGLAAAKIRTAKGWQDLTPVKPMTTGVRDSGGPVLHAPGQVGFPYGTAIEARKDGSVLVTGGWRTASGVWLRRGAFRYVPTRSGVSVSVPCRAGDRFEYSVFAVAPQVDGRTVQDGERRTTVSADAVSEVAGGYASGAQRTLARVRLAISTPRAGQLKISHTWPTPADTRRRDVA